MLDDLERAAASGAGERVMVTNLRKEKAPIELAAVTLDGHTRAFLKLQEGCDQFCTFCIVPFSRGASRSVEPRRVMAALDDLHARGFKEVVLTGVHLGGYGKDLEPPVELADLLEMIAERCPIERVRISSLDPEELSDRIVEIISSSGKFCPHLHLPLQSGDDETLARMRRRYQRDYFRDRVERVLRAWPDAAIGTDLIVGFPGETGAHFESYFNFVESHADGVFSRVSVFGPGRNDGGEVLRPGEAGGDQAASRADARTGRAQAGGIRPAIRRNET